MKKFFFAAAILSLTVVSCNDDDDLPEPDPEQFVRFEASGLLNGAFTGGGGAELTDEDAGKQLVLRFTDGHSFLLEFVKGPEEEYPEVPGVGVYSLGGLGSDADFSVVLTDLAQNTVFLGQTEGAMQVTASDNASAEGTFEFTTSTLTNPDNAVEVTGGVWRIAVPD